MAWKSRDFGFQKADKFPKQVGLGYYIILICSNQTFENQKKMLNFQYMKVILLYL